MVTDVVPSSPPVLALNFLSLIGFSNPTARHFFMGVAINNSRSRAFRKLSRAQQRKISYEFERVCMHSGRLELTKLAYTRLEGNLVRHRGDRLPSRTRHTGIRYTKLQGIIDRGIYVPVLFHTAVSCSCLLLCSAFVDNNFLRSSHSLLRYGCCNCPCSSCSCCCCRCGL